MSSKKASINRLEGQNDDESGHYPAMLRLAGKPINMGKTAYQPICFLIRHTVDDTHLRTRDGSRDRFLGFMQ